MIELTQINTETGELRGKISINENIIFLVSEQSTYNGLRSTSNDILYTCVEICNGSFTKELCVSESYDRVLRLANKF